MRVKFSVALVAAGVAALALALGAYGSNQRAHAASSSPFTVGLVTDIGGLNDHGFNHLAYVGLLQAEHQLHIKGSILQSNSGADYLPNLTRLAAHNKLVIANGFLMANDLETVAKQYPHVHFAIVDSPGGTAPDTAKNIEGIDFAEQQAGYPAGYLAGLYLKAHHYTAASAVGGQSVPAVIHYIAGYQAGVKAADPSAKVPYAYSQSFTDEAACKNLALNQISAGSKVVFQVAGGCGLGAISAGVSTHTQVIGVDADQAYLAPSLVLTSATKKVNVGVFTAIKNGMAGKYSSNLEETIKNGGVGIGTIDAAGAQFKTQVQHIISEMKSGKIKPPTAIQYPTG